MRACAFCGKSTEGRKAGTKYCSDAHRVAACRARKRAQEAESAAASGRASDVVAVTARDAPVTARGRGELLPPLCPDPNRCRHFMRFPSGPWTCSACHPRLGGTRLRVVRNEGDAREAA